MQEIEKIIKQTLTEQRYNHSVGAMKAAGKLAKIYGENVEEAELAGLIHDIAKELNKEEIEKALKKYKIEPDEIEKNHLGLLHAKLRSRNCKRKISEQTKKYKTQ